MSLEEHFKGRQFWHRHTVQKNLLHHIILTQRSSCYQKFIIELHNKFTPLMLETLEE